MVGEFIWQVEAWGQRRRSGMAVRIRIRIRIRNFYFQCSKCPHYYKDRTEDNEEQKSSTQFCKNCEEGLLLFRDLSMSM